MGISRIKPLTSQYHSVGGSRGRGLLCLAPQLVLGCNKIIIVSRGGARFWRVATGHEAGGTWGGDVPLPTIGGVWEGAAPENFRTLLLKWCILAHSEKLY